MRAVKPAELMSNQQDMLDLVYSGEILLISRPAEKNVVVMSEVEFNKRERALKNTEYLAKLDKSVQEIENGEAVDYTTEELRALIRSED